MGPLDPPDHVETVEMMELLVRENVHLLCCWVSLPLINRPLLPSSFLPFPFSSPPPPPPLLPFLSSSSLSSLPSLFSPPLSFPPLPSPLLPSPLLPSLLLSSPLSLSNPSSLQAHLVLPVTLDQLVSRVYQVTLVLMESVAIGENLDNKGTQAIRDPQDQGLVCCDNN